MAAEGKNTANKYDDFIISVLNKFINLPSILKLNILGDKINKLKNITANNIDNKEKYLFVFILLFGSFGNLSKSISLFKNQY